MGGDVSLNSLGFPLEEPDGTGEQEVGDNEEAVNAASWARVFHYAYSLVGNRTEAEDIAQDAFVILFKEVASGWRVRDFSAWMRGVTRHLVYSRHRELRPDLHSSLDEMNEAGNRALFEPVDPRPSPETTVIEKGIVRLTAQVVSGFPRKDRECILMYIRGYDFLQIAAILGVSRWTARRTTMRALKKLESRLNRSRK